MLDFFLYIFAGVVVGIAASFVPGLFYSEVGLVFFGFMTGINAAVFLASSAIAFSLFEFITTSIFEVGDDVTSFTLDTKFQAENLSRIAKTVSLGAIISIFLSIPLILVFQNLFSNINSTVKSSLLVILGAIILYTILSERSFYRKIFAVFIFAVTGVFGTLVQNSGFLPSNILLMPVFIGFYGFASFARKHSEEKIISPASMKDKMKISLVSFGTTLFAILVPSMKRSQASALALGLGKIDQSETVLLALSIISTSFLIISLVALSSNSIRSVLAYDVSEIAEMNYNQVLIVLGSFVIAATISIVLLLNCVKFLDKIIFKINKKYLKFFGLVCGIVLILYFTSWKGAILAFTATSIGILSIKMRIRSAHLMGFLLVPTLLKLAGI